MRSSLVAIGFLISIFFCPGCPVTYAAPVRAPAEHAENRSETQSESKERPTAEKRSCDGPCHFIAGYHDGNAQGKISSFLPPVIPVTISPCESDRECQENFLTPRPPLRPPDATLSRDVVRRE